MREQVWLVFRKPGDTESTSHSLWYLGDNIDAAYEIGKEFATTLSLRGWYAHVDRRYSPEEPDW